jgi:hypothetical protein
MPAGTGDAVSRLLGAMLSLTAALVMVILGTPPSSSDAVLVDEARSDARFSALPTLWWAAGSNTAGERGDGTTHAGTPTAERISWNPGVAFPRGTRVTAVSAGERSACGIAGGRLYCWGDNSHGQLGNGSTTSSAWPVAVATSPDAGSALPPAAVVTDVTVGDGAACAVADSSVYCWGDNASGRLGDGSLNGSTVPVQVLTAGAGGSAMPADVAERVSTGGGGPGSTTAYACAITAARAYCWGSRENGRLGNGVVSSIPRLVPVAVNSGAWGSSTGVTDVALGHHAACAVAGGRAYCWGRALYGQLGDGSNDPSTNQTIPTGVETAPFSSLPNAPLVSDVEVGASSACALHGGDAYCWGANRSGQLGAGLVVGMDPSSTAVSVAAAVVRTPEETSELPSGATVLHISPGGRLDGASAWCVIAALPSSAGRPYCWGLGLHGQLGTASPSDSNFPRAIPHAPVGGLPGASSIAGVAGGERTMFLVPQS